MLIKKNCRWHGDFYVNDIDNQDCPKCRIDILPTEKDKTTDACLIAMIGGVCDNKSCPTCYLKNKGIGR